MESALLFHHVWFFIIIIIIIIFFFLLIRSLTQDPVLLFCYGGPYKVTCSHFFVYKCFLEKEVKENCMY